MNTGSELKQSAEDASWLSRVFIVWTERSYDHAWWVLAFCLFVVAGLLSQVPKLKFDMSTEAMLHQSDPVRVNYDAFKKEFGREDAIVVSLPIQGGLDKASLANIHELHQAFDAEVPYVETITSIINARYTYGEDDEMIVEDLLEGYPNHKWDHRALTEYVITSPSYRNRLVSADAQHAAIVVELFTYDPKSESVKLLDDTQSADAVNTIRKIIDSKPELDAVMTGQPVLLTTIN